jgi:hypothetical protein
MEKVNCKTHNAISPLTMDDVKLVVSNGMLDCTGCVFNNEGNWIPCTKGEGLETCIVGNTSKKLRFAIFVMKDDVRETIKT